MNSIKTFFKKYPVFIALFVLIVIVMVVKNTGKPKEKEMETIPTTFFTDKKEVAISSNENTYEKAKQEIKQKDKGYTSEIQREYQRENQNEKTTPLNFTPEAPVNTAQNKKDNIYESGQIPAVQSKKQNGQLSQTVLVKSRAISPVQTNPIKDPKDKTIISDLKNDAETEHEGFNLTYQNQENDDAQGKTFIQAYTDNAYKITDGSSVIFRMSGDGIIEGKPFKKNSILYGEAHFENRVSVIVRTIKGIDGKIYQVNLECYDGDFLRGLAYKGTIEKATDESKTDILDGVAGDVPYGNLARAGKNIIRGYKAEKALHVDEGYKVYFKNSKR